MKTPQLLAFIGVGILSGTFALEEFMWGGLNAVPLALLTGLGATCLSVSLWRDRPVEERRYVSLGSVFCIYYSVSYGFAVLGTPPQFALRLLPGGLNAVDLAALPLGILAWLLGYRLLQLPALTRTARHMLLPRNTLRPTGPSTLFAFYATTLVVRLWLIVSGTGFGYLRNASEATTSVSSGIQYLTLYGEFGIVILGLSVLASGNGAGNNQGYRRLYLMMIPVELLFRLIEGSKSGILLLVLTVVLALAATGRLSLSTRKLVAVGVVAALVVFPLIGTYRDILRPEAGRQLSPVEAPASAVKAVRRTASNAAAGPFEYGRFAFDQTAGRVREIDRAAVSIQAHDAGKPFSSPSEMVSRVGTGLIPRLLWPEKPLNLYARDVSRGYYGASLQAINASSLSPVGDAYRYGGLVMVVVGLFFVGGFVRFLDDMLSPRHSVWLVPLLIAAVPLVRGGDIAGLLVGAIRYFLIVGIFYRFLFVRSPLASSLSSAGRPMASGRR